MGAQSEDFGHTVRRARPDFPTIIPAGFHNFLIPLPQDPNCFLKDVRGRTHILQRTPLFRNKTEKAYLDCTWKKQNLVIRNGIPVFCSIETTAYRIYQLFSSVSPTAPFPLSYPMLFKKARGNSHL